MQEIFKFYELLFQIKIVLTCDVCKKLFNTAAERMIHYLNTKDCKVHIFQILMITQNLYDNSFKNILYNITGEIDEISTKSFLP